MAVSGSKTRLGGFCASRVLVIPQSLAETPTFWARIRPMQLEYGRLKAYLQILELLAGMFGSSHSTGLAAGPVVLQQEGTAG